MDLGALDGGEDGGGKKPVTLPDDLPKSLNDRRIVRTELMPETEMYDGWQGAFDCFPPLFLVQTGGTDKRIACFMTSRWGPRFGLL